MDRLCLDTSGMSKMLELCKSGRQRKIARLYYVNTMGVSDISKQTGYAECVIVSELNLINTRIESNISGHTCGQCQGIYYSTKPHSKICPTCKVKNQKEYLEHRSQVYKTRNSPKSVAKKDFKSIAQIEKDRAEYNSTHKVNLSYGKYVALVGE